MGKKKMNTYLKYGLWILVFACVGGILGYLAAYAEDGILSIENLVSQAVSVVRSYILPELLVLLLVEVLIGEYSIKKMKAYAAQIENAEDEVFDRLDYELEKSMAVGNGILTLVAVISIAMLSTTYSLSYIQSIGNATNIYALLAAFVVFIVIYVYNGYWGVRVIKMEQKRDPDKKGDPTSTRFTEQWVESCDEAEKELIYQSAYKTYVFLMKWIPVLLIVTMLMHLLWNTGIAAVIIVGVIWLLLSLSYQRNAVQKKGKKLER